MTMQTTESTAMVKGPQARFQKISDVLTAKKDAIAALLPKHLTADRMLRVALSACSRNPDLLMCTPQSLVLSLAVAAYFGIEPNLPNGRGYLIPRANNTTQGGQKEATFLLGYKGYIYLAMNTGEVEAIESQIAYDKESFRVRLGTESCIEHERSVRADRGAPVAYYAVAKMKNGGRLFEVMTPDEVNKIRARSAAAGSGPWVTDYEQMARKTVIRRLANYLVLDDQRIAVAGKVDDPAEGASPDFSDILDAHPDPKALTVGEDSANGAAPSQSQTAPVDRGQALAEQLGTKK